MRLWLFALPVLAGLSFYLAFVLIRAAVRLYVSRRIRYIKRDHFTYRPAPPSREIRSRVIDEYINQ